MSPSGVCNNFCFVKGDVIAAMMTRSEVGQLRQCSDRARYKAHNPGPKSNHCACHKGSLSAADCAAGVLELAVFTHQVKTFYNFFGHRLWTAGLGTARCRRLRMQETVRHLKKGIVNRCVCAPVPVRYRGLASGFRTVENSKINLTFAPPHTGGSPSDGLWIRWKTTSSLFTSCSASTTRRL